MKKTYRVPMKSKRLSEKLSVPKEYAGSPEASQITYALLQDMQPSLEKQLKLNGIMEKIKEAEQKWLDGFADSDNEQDVKMNTLRDVGIDLSIRGRFVNITFALTYNYPLVAQFKGSQEDWGFWYNEGRIVGETICKEINKIIKDVYPEITVEDGALDRWERDSGYIENYYICYINANKLPKSFIQMYSDKVQIRESFNTLKSKRSTLSEAFDFYDDAELMDEIDADREGISVLLAQLDEALHKIDLAIYDYDNYLGEANDMIEKYSGSNVYEDTPECEYNVAVLNDAYDDIESEMNDCQNSLQTILDYTGSGEDEEDDYDEDDYDESFDYTNIDERFGYHLKNSKVLTEDAPENFGDYDEETATEAESDMELQKAKKWVEEGRPCMYKYGVWNSYNPISTEKAKALLADPMWHFRYKDGGYIIVQELIWGSSKGQKVLLFKEAGGSDLW